MPTFVMVYWVLTLDTYIQQFGVFLLHWFGNHRIYHLSPLWVYMGILTTWVYMGALITWVYIGTLTTWVYTWVYIGILA